MFVSFFYFLRYGGLPLGIKDLLNLLEALNKEVTGYSVEDFYFLCKTILVKDEQHLDRFDVLFGLFFEDIDVLDLSPLENLDKEWLKKGTTRDLSDLEKSLIESLGGLEKLMERMKKLLEEQKKRHEGGSKWIGTGGISPFGAYGYNPEGFRIGQDRNRSFRAVKVWDKREFHDLRGDLDLETRDIKMALKSLRHLTREGPLEELDLDQTIKRTTKNAGILDISMVPPKKNNVKILLFLDVGGSMDEHILSCERLFTAARYEFKHLEHYYFHNCIYEFVWKENARRRSDKYATFDLLHKYNPDYKVIIVGDASMSPIELTYEGGSVEHWNTEAGVVWLERIKNHFKDIVWLNPTHFEYWNYTPSIKYLQKFFDYHMFPLTINGLQLAVKALKNKKYQYGTIK